MTKAQYISKHRTPKLSKMTIGDKIQYLPKEFTDKLRDRLSESMSRNVISARFLSKEKVKAARIQILLDLLSEYKCKMTVAHFYANDFHLYMVNKNQIECRYSIDNQQKNKS